MTFGNVRLALRALSATRLRTALTLLGVLIGTAAVILLVGVVTGSRSLVQRSMEALGTKAVWVLTNENPDNGTGTRSRFTRLRPSDVSALKDPRRAPDVVSVQPVAKTQVTVTWEGTTYNPASFAATPPGLAAIYNVKLSRGAFYSEANESDHARVAVLGQDVVDHLIDHGVDPVGQKISINNVAFKVVGALSARGANAMGLDHDDIVVAPWTTVRAHLASARPNAGLQSAYPVPAWGGAHRGSIGNGPTWARGNSGADPGSLTVFVCWYCCS